MNMNPILAKTHTAQASRVSLRGLQVWGYNSKPEKRPSRPKSLTPSFHKPRVFMKEFRVLAYSIAMVVGTIGGAPRSRETEGHEGRDFGYGFHLGCLVGSG